MERMPTTPEDPLRQGAALLDDILWDVAQGAVARLGLEDCVIYLFDLERRFLIQRAAYGPKNPKGREILEPIRLLPGKGVVGTVAQTGLPLRIADTRLDPRYIPDDRNRRSELAVPLLLRNQVLGVIDSEHSKPNFFTEAHERTLTTIAAVTASRIGRARFEPTPNAT